MTGCPTRHELQDFIAGRGDEPARALVAEHVDACAACQDELDRITDRPELVAATVEHDLNANSRFSLAHQTVRIAAGTLLDGRYRLRAVLGEGGMGTVWAAEQIAPVSRPVAVKLIKPGMDSGAILARFEAERQALALMDHPNIARVFDGGMTAAGWPFFVMELVEGKTLTEYCDSSRVSIADRLRLFSEVCEAVQHAHQKGIIHRDLKPSNILVSTSGARPTPKVIDFGVAKAVGAKLTELPLTTQIGMVVGTLEYMAPEQAGAAGADVDTRADIYSLGVILYELLTGLRPIDARRLRSAALSEMLRIIHEEEPSKPSTRVSGVDVLPSVAALRQTEPRRLMTLLRGELDWVVMKCLEKQRDRRYATASDLAHDLQRFLVNEPVEARPPSVAYRVSKFVRRHRGPVIAAGLLLLALVGGVVGTSIGIVKANHQAEIARANEAAADRERQRAIEFRDRALDALRAMTGDDVEKLLGEKPELGPNERGYLDAIISRWLVFANAVGDDEQSTALRGEGHTRVGHLRLRQGRRNDALDELAKARELWERLVERFPHNEVYSHGLAATLHKAGVALFETGRAPAGLEMLDRAQEIASRIVRGDRPAPPHVALLAGIHTSRSAVLTEMQSYSNAVADLEQARAIQNRLVELDPNNAGYQSQLAAATNNLGVALVAAGQHDRASGEFQKSLDAYRGLNERHPNDPGYRLGLSLAVYSMGDMHRKAGRLSDAVRDIEQSLALQQKLIEEYPNVPDYQRRCGLTLSVLAQILYRLERPDDASRRHDEAVRRLGALVKQYPESVLYQTDLGATCCDYGVELYDRGRFEESAARFDQAIQLLNVVHRVRPQDPRAFHCLRVSHFNRGNAYAKLQRFALAAPDYGRALELDGPNPAPVVQFWRVMALLKSGEAAQAARETEAMRIGIDEFPRDRWTTHQWFGFGAIYSNASGVTPERSDEYARRAIALFRVAVKAGFNELHLFDTDPDLAAVRNRPEFRQFVSEVKARDVGSAAK